MTLALHPMCLIPGTVVSVRVTVGPVPVDHFGIVSDARDCEGYPLVLSGSKRRDRKVTEEDWRSFVDGGTSWKAYDMASAVSTPVMLRRARADLGKRWDLLAQNCEHLIRRWRGLNETSPQLVRGVLVLAVVALVLVACSSSCVGGPR